jgi:hypothetical protein
MSCSVENRKRSFGRYYGDQREPHMAELWPYLRVTQRTDATRDNRHLQQRICVLKEPAANSVPRLVVRHCLLLLLAEHPALPLQTGNHTLNSSVEVRLRHRVPATTSSTKGTLIADVGYVGTGEAGGEERELLRDPFKGEV